jgi:hypothetical protein
MDQSLQEYRQYLVSAKQQAQNNYDKHLISLSGGALGISIAFIHNIVGNHILIYTGYLLSAWSLWTAAIALMLISFFTSRIAFDIAIKQVDTGVVWKEHVGGVWDRITAVVNILSGLCFLSGVISIIIFIIHNLWSSNA